MSSSAASRTATVKSGSGPSSGPMSAAVPMCQRTAASSAISRPVRSAPGRRCAAPRPSRAAPGRAGCAAGRRRVPGCRRPGCGRARPPAEQLGGLPDQRGRDVVPGGQPQPLGRVAEQPGQRGQRLVRQVRRLEQPGITLRASRDRSPGCPCAHSSIRSALIRLSQVSIPGAFDGRVSQRSTSPARLPFQPLTPTLSSRAATASSSSANLKFAAGRRATSRSGSAAGRPSAPRSSNAG